MYTDIFLLIHTYVYIYTHLYIHKYILFTYTHTCIYIYLHIYIYTNILALSSSTFTFGHMYNCLCIHIRVCIYVYSLSWPCSKRSICECLGLCPLVIWCWWHHQGDPEKVLKTPVQLICLHRCEELWPFVGTMHWSRQILETQRFHPMAHDEFWEEIWVLLNGRVW